MAMCDSPSKSFARILRSALSSRTGSSAGQARPMCRGPWPRQPWSLRSVPASTPWKPSTSPSLATRGSRSRVIRALVVRRPSRIAAPQSSSYLAGGPGPVIAVEPVRRAVDHRGVDRDQPGRRDVNIVVLSLQSPADDEERRACGLHPKHPGNRSRHGVLPHLSRHLMSYYPNAKPPADLHSKGVHVCRR